MHKACWWLTVTFVIVALISLLILGGGGGGEGKKSATLFHLCHDHIPKLFLVVSIHDRPDCPWSEPTEATCITKWMNWAQAV